MCKCWKVCMNSQQLSVLMLRIWTAWSDTVILFLCKISRSATYSHRLPCNIKHCGALLSSEVSSPTVRCPQASKQAEFALTLWCAAWVKFFFFISSQQIDYCSWYSSVNLVFIITNPYLMFPLLPFENSNNNNNNNSFSCPSNTQRGSKMIYIHFIFYFMSDWVFLCYIFQGKCILSLSIPGIHLNSCFLLPQIIIFIFPSLLTYKRVKMFCLRKKSVTHTLNTKSHTSRGCKQTERCKINTTLMN